jgi:hypothetical protein
MHVFGDAQIRDRFAFPACGDPLNPSSCRIDLGRNRGAVQDQDAIGAARDPARRRDATLRALSGQAGAEVGQADRQSTPASRSHHSALAQARIIRIAHRPAIRFGGGAPP